MKKLTILFLGLIFINGACSYRTYVADRAIRQLTGRKTRVHMITPWRADLGRYRVLEVHRLDNLMLDQIPPQLQKYLNDKIWEEIQSARLFDEVVRPGQEIMIEEDKAAKPTLVFEGKIDDYHPGYLGLRLIELGYNHISTTVRFQLSDKQTGEVLGSASITVQEDRPNGTPKSVASRLSKRIKKFIRSGFQKRM